MHFESVAVCHLELTRANKQIITLATLYKSEWRREKDRSRSKRRGNKAYRVRGIRRLHSRAVKQEPHRVEGLALALAKGRHELLELGAALDLEEDLVVVVGDLDVEVLGVGGRGLAIAWGLVLVVLGHVCCVVLCARASVSF